MGLIDVQPRGGRLLAVPLRPLRSLRFAAFETGGHSYLRISAMGILAGVAERMPQGEVSLAWKARAGSYQIVPRGEKTNYRACAPPSPFSRRTMARL
jgi:hypothetical protein